MPTLVHRPGEGERNHYMRDLGAAAKLGPLAPEIIGRIAARYDFHTA